MKARTRTIFVACFAIATFNNFGTGVEVSSKVDLDSDENEETLSNKTFNTTANRSAYPSESVLRASKPIINWRHENGLVKTSEPRKRRIYPLHDDSAKRPKIINNIQIVINGNDSMPSGDMPCLHSCKHGICNVSVSSKPDEEGNIITEVHLSIITNAKSDVKIDDIPVIDGFRGVSENHEKQPTFQPISMPNLVRSNLQRDNIPQIQINHERYGEPYQYRRTFQRPQIYYQQFGDRGNMGFRGHKTWSRERPIVDDKIAPPLSKTKSNDMYTNS